MGTNNINLLFNNNDTNCDFFTRLKTKIDIKDYSNLDSLQDKINHQIRIILHLLTNDKLVLEDLLIDMYCIKPEDIPESYFEYRWDEALRRGELTNISDTNKKSYINKNRDMISNYLLSTQKQSLFKWIEYLNSPENQYIPLYLRYFIFKRILGIGAYNRSKKKFERRNKSCTAPFPEINSEALHKVINSIQDYTGEAPLKFRKLYSREFATLQEDNEKNWEITTGKWMYFKKDSDANILVKLLEGKNSGLCIANLETAKKYLKKGGLEIYFSDNEQGEPVNPRLAIHIIDNEINEVRGVKENQNIDQYILKTLDTKLEELPGGDKYLSRCENMRVLSRIYDKYLDNKTLTNPELRFIYEIDNRIQGFGYGKDGRIDKIITERNIKKDLSSVLDCKPEQISSNNKEAISGDILYHFGDLVFDELEVVPKGFVLPKQVRGNLYFTRLQKLPDNFVLPEVIGGNMSLSCITKLPEGCIFPRYIGERLFLNKLTELPENFVFPKIIGNSLLLPQIKAIPGTVIFPKEIGGDLLLTGLQVLTNKKVLPDVIYGSLALSRIISLPDNFCFPEIIGESLILNSLRSFPDNIVLPKKIGCNLILTGFKEFPDNFVVPKCVKENVCFYKDIVLPKDLPENIQTSSYCGPLV